MISNSVIFLTALMTIWCSFDVAGRYWVQLKKHQNSKNSKSKSLRSDGGCSELFSKQPALVMSMSLNTSNQDVPPLFLQQNPTKVCALEDKTRIQSVALITPILSLLIITSYSSKFFIISQKNVHAKGLRGNPNRSWKHR